MSSAATGSVEQAVRALRTGGIVAAATESFFGLSVDALDDRAVRALFALKGRAPTEPVPVLVGSVAQAEELAAEVPAAARSLMARHWPGPLTIVLRAAPVVPDLVCGGTGKIGLRVPGPCPAADVLRLFGRPMTATSANTSGAPPLTRAQDVRSAFGVALAVVVPGTAPGGMASTVVDLTVEPYRILRHGPIHPGE